MNPDVPLPPETTENTIEGIAADEILLGKVQRHPFGLFVVYTQLAIGFIAGAVLLYFMTPVVFTNIDAPQRRLYLSVILGLLAILLWLILIVYTYIYRQSKLVITDRNLTQVLQHGLFNRKVSELSLANVEDVTASQKGILASIFGYGNLIVETAGEQANFDFKYCPRPNYYGKVILDARQKFIQTNPNTNRRR